MIEDFLHYCYVAILPYSLNAHSFHPEIVHLPDSASFV